MKSQPLLFLVVLAVVATLATVDSLTPARADHSAASCGDVTLVFARGSGSALGAREATKFFDAIDARLGASVEVNDYELGEQVHGGALYPAVGVTGSLQSYKNLIEADASWTGGLGGQYRSSVTSGVSELNSYLASRSARCPDEAFAVGGYSQGAHVVGDALSALSRSVRDRIAFVSLFGDPKLYLPEGRGPFPPACRGREFSPWRRGSVSCWTDNGILEARRPYLPADMDGRAGSWCDRNDGICNNNIVDLAGPEHGQYAAEGAEIDEAAREIAGALEARLPDKADDIDTSVVIVGLGTAGLDVAFVIDTTGSMAGSIGAARSIAEAAGETIVGARGRVALTEYRDLGDPVVSEVLTPLTTDIGAFRSSLSGLFASGGGDTPEALLHALMTTLNGLDWTPGATKAAVVLTDAGYHDPDLAGGYTRADVAARALEIDPVNVYPVVPSHLESTYRPLADDTTGKVVLDGGDTASALLDAVGEIEMRPVALLGSGEYVAAPGDAIRFDASRSYDPDSTLTSFEWDFNADGHVDEVTPGPSVEHAYAAPYDGLVEVRVHSADGGVANAVASVKVDETGLSGVTPGAPVNLRAAAAPQGDGRRRVTLSWQRPAGPAPIGGWVILNEAGDVLAHRDAGATTFAIADVPLERVVLRVAATNAYGAGPAAEVAVAAAAAHGAAPPASPPASPPPATKPALRIRRLSLSRKRFAAAPARRAGVAAKGRRRGKRQRPRIGTRVRYRLSAAAKVRLRVVRRKARGAAGRKLRRRCRQRGRAYRRRTRCNRRLMGAFVDRGEQGKNGLRFRGRIRGRRLRPGRYVLVARAKTSDGDRSKPKRVGFRIVKQTRRRPR